MQEKRPDNEYQVCSYRLVGIIGFEPMIFCSQSRRGNQAALYPEAHIFWGFEGAKARERERNARIVPLGTLGMVPRRISHPRSVRGSQGVLTAKEAKKSSDISHGFFPS